MQYFKILPVRKQDFLFLHKHETIAFTNSSYTKLVILSTDLISAQISI